MSEERQVPQDEDSVDTAVDGAGWPNDAQVSPVTVKPRGLGLLSLAYFVLVAVVLPLVSFMSGAPFLFTVLVWVIAVGVYAVFVVSTLASSIGLSGETLTQKTLFGAKAIKLSDINFVKIRRLRRATLRRFSGAIYLGHDAHGGVYIDVHTFKKETLLLFIQHLYQQLALVKPAVAEDFLAVAANFYPELNQGGVQESNAEVQEASISMAGDKTALITQYSDSAFNGGTEGTYRLTYVAVSGQLRLVAQDGTNVFDTTVDNVKKTGILPNFLSIRLKNGDSHYVRMNRETAQEWRKLLSTNR